MIEPKEWISFSNEEETVLFLKKHSLIPSKAEQAKMLRYEGGFSQVPVLCKVVGEAPPTATVIDISGELHCINTELLKEMQKGASKWIKEAEESI